MKKLSTLLFLFVLLLTKSSIAQISPCNLEANFTSTAVTTTANTFSFQNTSTPVNATDSAHWNFGDGTSSTDISPTHTFPHPGNYWVCLRMQQRDASGNLTTCIREKCHSVFVQAPPCNLEANFTSTIVTTTANTFSFQNTSTPANATDSAHWNFGDGTSSTDISPTHTFPHPGNYWVCLRMQQRDASGNLTTCIREKCHSVFVQAPPCNLEANFTSTAVTTTANTFSFQNTSTPANATDSAHWNFGDGTSSTDISPTHTFPHPGNYWVCLRMQQRDANGNLTSCIREKCHSVFVPAPPCILEADFTSTAVTTTPNTFSFQNTSTPANATDSAHWNFGDGTSSTDISPTHTFPHPGNYWVCLRMQQRDANGNLTSCIRESCHHIVVGTQNPPPPICNLQPFPNPVTNSVSVNVSLGIPQMIDVYIYNTLNILVKEKHQPGLVGNNVVTLMTGDLTAGIYVMKVIHGTDVCYTVFLKL